MDYVNEQDLNDYLIYGSSDVDLSSIEFMVLLIQVGAEVNCTDPHGNTPLILAASKGYVTRMALLLQAGADPGIANKQGQTAFSLAITQTDSKAHSLLFFIMTDEQLQNEVQYNNIRRVASDSFVPNLEYFNPNLEYYIKQLKDEKNKEIFQALKVLFLSSKHIEKNPFLILPRELKSFIYLKYLAVSVKKKIEEHCSVFENCQMHSVLDNSPQPIIFSPKICAQNKKIKPEKLHLKFSLLSFNNNASDFTEKEGKNIKKRKGCVIS